MALAGQYWNRRQRKFDERKRHTQNNNCTCITIFCAFLSRHSITTTRKFLMKRFMKDVNRASDDELFFPFLNLDIVRRNSTLGRFACVND